MQRPPISEDQPRPDDPWPAPIKDGGWTDDDGTWWQLRGPGQDLLVKRVRKLLLSPEIRVLLFYGPDAPTEIDPADRQALWQRMQHSLSGMTRVARGSAAFEAAEFKDERGHRMLIIQEYC